MDKKKKTTQSVISSYPTFTIISSEDPEMEITNPYSNSSIYRNKLQHIIDILEWFKFDTKNLEIQTKDIFIRDLIQEWMNSWRQENFMINKDRERPNSDLLREIDLLIAEYKKKGRDVSILG